MAFDKISGEEKWDKLQK